VPDPAPTNLILVHCHDLGRFLGCYGVQTVRTPNLDAFASDGVLFEQAYCTAPQCSPSRAALFTGRYPHQTGVMGLTQKNFDWDMRAGERHIASLLGDVGYESVLVGVHHESRKGSDAMVAAQLGFDVVQQRNQRGTDVTHIATAQLERLAAGDRPFYLQLGYFEPHRLHNRTKPEDGYLGFIADYIEPDAERGVTIPPYLRDEGSARVEIAELQGAVHYLDEQVGVVFDTIHRLGLEERTIVIFTTDHGLGLPRAKASLYDPGLEVALAIRCPGRGWTGGRRVSGLVSNVDVVPTLLEALDVTIPDNISGESFLSLLDESTPPDTGREQIFGELTYHLYYDPRRCVRTEKHKFVANFTVAPGFMDSSGSWRPRTRPVADQGIHPSMELYDLEADPLEETNLADDPAYAPIRADLAGRLAAWMRETEDPLWTGPVPSPLGASTLGMLTVEVPAVSTPVKARNCSALPAQDT